MADKRYPTDQFANPLRKGDHVMQKLADAAMLFMVEEVEPAMLLDDGHGNPLPTRGRIILQARIELPFTSDSYVFANMYSVRMPEPENIVVSGAPSLVRKPS